MHASVARSLDDGPHRRCRYLHLYTTSVVESFGPEKSQKMLEQETKYLALKSKGYEVLGVAMQSHVVKCTPRALGIAGNGNKKTDKELSLYLICG